MCYPASLQYPSLWIIWAYSGITQLAIVVEKIISYTAGFDSMRCVKTAASKLTCSLLLAHTYTFKIMSKQIYCTKTTILATTSTHPKTQGVILFFSLSSCFTQWKKPSVFFLFFLIFRLSIYLDLSQAWLNPLTMMYKSPTIPLIYNGPNHALIPASATYSF